jgi:hypothetical protein
MTAVEILATLARRGVRVEVAGDRLRLRPADRVPPELVDVVRDRKPELLAALLPGRILEALAAGPMTARSLARALGADRADVWREVEALWDRGAVWCEHTRELGKPGRLMRARPGAALPAGWWSGLRA